MADNQSQRKRFEPLRQHEGNQKKSSQGQPGGFSGDFDAYLTSSQVPTFYPDTVWRSAAENSAIHTLAAREHQSEAQPAAFSGLKAAGIEGTDFTMPAPNHSTERDADSLADAALLVTPELLLESPEGDGPEGSDGGETEDKPTPGKKQTRCARLKQCPNQYVVG